MGIRCSSELRRGQRYITMKLLLLTVFVAVALAEEIGEGAAATAVVPLLHPLHQLHWSASYGVGFSSRCYGCFRGKRSAEAEPEAEADPALAYLPYGYGYYGHPLVYRAVTPGVAAHPGAATSLTQRSVQFRRRRSAEAEAEPGLLYHPYAYGLPYYHVPVVPVVKGDGVAVHPNAATSHVAPTTWGL